MHFSERDFPNEFIKKTHKKQINTDSNMTSFFRFVNKLAI